MCTIKQKRRATPSMASLFPLTPYPALRSHSCVALSSVRLKHYYDTIYFALCQCTTLPSRVYSFSVEGVQLRRRHCSIPAFLLFSFKRSGCSTRAIYSIFETEIMTLQFRYIDLLIILLLCYIIQLFHTKHV